MELIRCHFDNNLGLNPEEIILPVEIMFEISNFTGENTKQVLSKVNKSLQKAFFDTVKCIKMRRPEGYFKGDLPENILENVIRRYANLNEIIFGDFLSFTGKYWKEEIVYLKFLINVGSQQKEHLLNSVKKIKFLALSNGGYGTGCYNFVKEMRKELPFFIGHQNLENVRFISRGTGPALKEREVQPILNNSPNLKSFILDGDFLHKFFDLSFENNLQISKIKLLDWNGSAKTIASIINCKKLEEMVIRYRGETSEEIIEIFAKNTSWDFKRLEIKNIVINTDKDLDLITKKLQNLWCLSMDFNKVTNDGMVVLGKNCPNLKVLNLAAKI